MYKQTTYIRENKKTKDVILICENEDYKGVGWEMSVEKGIEFIGRNKTDYSKFPYDELKEEYIFKI